MLAVTAYAAQHPGCPKIDPAYSVSPHPEAGLNCGLPYGYRSVDRAIRAGLISARKLPRRWELYVTNKGKKELEMRS